MRNARRLLISYAISLGIFGAIGAIVYFGFDRFDAQEVPAGHLAAMPAPVVSGPADPPMPSPTPASAPPGEERPPSPAPGAEPDGDPGNPVGQEEPVDLEPDRNRGNEEAVDADRRDRIVDEDDPGGLDDPGAGGDVPAPRVLGLDPRIVGERLIGHKADVWGLAFRPQTLQLVSIGDDGVIIGWDCARARPNFEEKIAGNGRGLAFDRGGAWRVMTSMTPYAPAFSGVLKVVSQRNGQATSIESESRFTFQAAAINRPGTMIAAGGADRSLRAWDLRNPLVVRDGDQLKPGFFAEFIALAMPDEIRAIDFHPTEPMIAVGCAGGYVRLVTIDRSRARLVESSLKFAGHAGDTHCVRFSPDGRILYSGGDDSRIRAIEAGTGRLIRSMAVAAPVRSLAVSPDGALLISAQDDVGGTVCFWEAATGALLKRIDAHPKGALGLDLTADGRRMASGGRDFTIALWELYEPGPVVEQPRERRRGR